MPPFAPGWRIHEVKDGTEKWGLAQNHPDYPIVSVEPWLSPRGQGTKWGGNHLGREEVERGVPLKQTCTPQSKILGGWERWEILETSFSI